MKKYFIGIDGGATKTKAVLCEDTGFVLSKATGGPTNLSSSSYDEVLEILHGLFSEVIEKSGVKVSEIVSVYAGLAGGITYQSLIFDIIKQFFSDDVLINNGVDAINILNCGLLLNNGIGIISGTGSACFVRIDNKFIQIGGWGYYIDLYGSGYDIGRCCLNAAVRAFDGRGDKTLISKLYEEKFGKPIQLDMERIYKSSISDIAGLSSIVFEASALGDNTAKKIIDENMFAVHELISAAKKHFDYEHFPVSVALGGGIFKNEEALTSLKKFVLDDVVFSPLPTDPVFGAVFEAIKNYGLKIDESLRDNFINSF